MPKKQKLTENKKPISVGALLSDLARQFRTSFDRQGRSLGLTRPQWLLLLYLRRNEGLTQTELAAGLELATPTVTHLVHRLIKRGWIEMRVDPSHRLNKYLYLQPAVHPLLNDVRRVAQSIDRKSLRGLSKTEIHTLYELLFKLKANLADSRPKRGSDDKARLNGSSRLKRADLVRIAHPAR